MDTSYVGLAREFLADQEPIIYHNEQCLQYNGRHYDEVSLDRLKIIFRRWCLDAPTPKECNIRLTNEVGQEILARGLVNGSRALPFWWGQEQAPVKNIIPFANGLLDVGTWELLPHTASFVCHYSLPYDYEPEAKCATWMRFLGEVYEGDPARIGLLQEWVGYCMVSDISYHKMLGLVGVQRSGKSTILQVMEAIVGKGHCTAASMSQLASPFALESMVGKQVALISEVEIENHPQINLIIERVKSITGGDSAEIQRKHQKSLSTVLPTRLMFAANRMPLLFDGSRALADRMLLVEHRVSFLGKEDQELLPQLLEEVEGIATWALAGLKRLRSEKRFTVVRSDTRDRFYRASASVQSFLSERCLCNQNVVPVHFEVHTTKELVEIDRIDLYAEYCDYCDQHSIFARSEKGFHHELSEKLPQLTSHRPQGDGGRRRRYQGITVMPL